MVRGARGREGQGAARASGCRTTRSRPSQAYKVAIKGPLTTPVGGGIRSLNVTLRQVLDLYACVRPVRYFTGTPAPVTHPERMNVVIFRENTEDVYAGIELAQGTPQAAEAHRVPRRASWARRIRPDSGIGIKPISETGTKRLVRMAIQYAHRHTSARRVTLVHKGNIMKFTEGAFRDWGYEVAKAEFRDRIVTEDETCGRRVGARARSSINDRIADSVFQQVLTRTADYDVFATPNLNGDYLSDACAAQVGGLGMAPGANIGDEIALLRGHARHGAEVRRQGRHQPGVGHPVGRDDVPLPGLDARRRDLIETALGEDHRAEDGHLRSGAADGRAPPSSRRRSSPTPSSPTCRACRQRTLSSMNRKVTVVGGAGNVGATVARAIADKELADVVIIDIAEEKAAGVGARHASRRVRSRARTRGSSATGDYADRRPTPTSSSSPPACRASPA